MRLPKPAPSLERLHDLMGELSGQTLLDVPFDDRTYHHWDDLTYRPPPDGLTREQWWAALKVQRHGMGRPVPLPAGPPSFQVVLTGGVQERLMRVDQSCAGTMGSGLPELSDDDRRRFVISALREEAIQSSLLEGAATTRAQAKQLLREGRAPATHGERMVVNNYAGMEHIVGRTDRPLDAHELLELHAILTRGTLDDPGDEGRYQTPDDDRVVVLDRLEGTVLHRPPPASQIPAHVEALCAFANGEDVGWFVHPVLRAVVTHFWLSWLHPFADGNGRTARALFFWVMLRNGYWLVEYLPVSRQFRKAPNQYARAFLLAETDHLDITYFVLHHLDVLLRTTDDAMAYIRSKMQDTRRVERRLRGLLNPRQLALVEHALSHEDPEYTIASHQRSHGVSYPTARSDLMHLEELGLLTSWKRGRRFVFAKVDGFANAIESLRSHRDAR